jgi:hypothetical protein
VDDSGSFGGYQAKNMNMGHDIVATAFFLGGSQLHLVSV